MTELVVEFAGEQHCVERRLTFGRTADLDIDINKYLHRRVGEFLLTDRAWSLRNVGSHIHLSVFSDEGKRVDLPPGSVEVLASATGVVRFTAGPANYELSYAIRGLTALESDDSDLLGESTTQFALALTPREVDFLVTFAEAQLLGRDDAMPTYADVARRWGVSPKTLDNTLQSIKRKARNSGLAREVALESLIGLIVRHGLVTRADLEWADLEGDAPKSAAMGPRFGGQ